MKPRLAVLLAAAFAANALLAGCDMLGIESPEKVAAAREAEGKAVGGACRHAGRAIEDCYALYRKADKAAIFAGWREMNDYMRENKIEAVVPSMSAPPAAKPAVLAKAETAPAEEEAAPAAAKPAAKPAPKPAKEAATQHDS